MLNTFYKRYEENKQIEVRAIKLGEGIKSMIKSIGYNEQMLFRGQKTEINHQVQLEGQLLGEKAKLKEETQKGKDLEQEEKRVQPIYQEHKKRYDDQKARLEQLQSVVVELQGRLVGLSAIIDSGQEIRQGNQDRLTDEMVYQLKFQEQWASLRDSMAREQQREKRLKMQL